MANTRFVSSLTCSLALWLASPSHGQFCTGAWSDDYAGGIDAGAFGVFALARYDHGSGEKLYAGGRFHSVDGNDDERLLTAWDGSRFTPLAFGIGGLILDLAVWRDEAGRDFLIAAGDFRSAGGVPAEGIARWDGTNWFAFSNDVDGDFRAITVMDDGENQTLYAAGLLTLHDGVDPQWRVLRWTGQEWVALGDAFDDDVTSLAIFDDGTEPALYAGGLFTEVGGAPIAHISRFDGSDWTAVGGGMNDDVRAIESGHALDPSEKPMLYAAGWFTEAGGESANHIAAWDGVAWHALGEGTPENLNSLRFVNDDESAMGPALFAGATSASMPTSRVLRWNGAVWQALDEYTLGSISAFEPFETSEGGEGTGLYSGGSGYSGVPLAYWTETEWRLTGHGLNESCYNPGTYGSSSGRTLHVHNDGTGDKLYAGGCFSYAGTYAANSIAQWDGNNWSGLGEGVHGVVYALKSFDDGSGNALYVGGTFDEAGGFPVSNIARWDGAEWSALGDGVDGLVRAMVVHDDGTGPALYVAGSFSFAGGVPANSIAKWDGKAWSPLGDGISTSVTGFDAVYALASYDEGSGLVLFAAGKFQEASGVDTSAIARWDGTEWSDVAGGLTWADGETRAFTLAVFDDGTAHGESLYVGGLFDHAGTVPADTIARWDGQTWSSVGEIIAHSCLALSVFDDGHGSALYMSGFLLTPFFDDYQQVARWRGERWESVDWTQTEAPHSIFALHGWVDSQSGSRSLFAVGNFVFTSNNISARHIARYDFCPLAALGDLNDDGVIDLLDFELLIGAWGSPGCGGTLPCAADLDHDGDVDFDDFAFLLSNWS